ncbi:roadblock/LC7 domain-containing protein [Streptomyces monticola]|uniref:Roadblock/LC7 domain-containing protein n=1 Tax=Streptomyces monticola TaxID=2666263 RepID=A0ABW2JFN0_9ACTN
MHEQYALPPAAPAALPQSGRAVGEFRWLLQRFLDQTPGLLDVAVVSADGVLLARAALPEALAPELTSPIASGVAALAYTGSELLGSTPVQRTVIEMQHCVLIVMAVGDGSLLAVSADAAVDRAVLGYEMTRLVRRVGQVLTPALRTTLRGQADRTTAGTAPGLPAG